jgi:hypothetical protein
MKGRGSPLVVPESSRYFSIDLGDKGAHHLRFPMLDTASRLQAWLMERQVPDSAGGALYSGAVIGAFWWHRAKRLEAALPLRADHDAIDAYAAAVLDELQDDDYTAAEIKALGTACDEALADWIRGIARAREVADFTPAPAADST